MPFPQAREEKAKQEAAQKAEKAAADAKRAKELAEKQAADALARQQAAAEALSAAKNNANGTDDSNSGASSNSRPGHRQEDSMSGLVLPVAPTPVASSVLDGEDNAFMSAEDAENAESKTGWRARI